MAAIEENGLDPTMGINNFGEVKILSDTETICRNLLMVLFGKPGFYPSIPDLGMDITQYLYSFETLDTNAIEGKLQDQCANLIPGATAGDFHITMTHYKGQGMLIVQFPIIKEDDKLAMALGITTDGHGSFMYHFVEDKNQVI